MIGTTLAFLLPLIYVTNQEMIDQHLKSASDVVEAQTAQVRSVAQKQAQQVTAIGKQYAGDYTGKVQEMLGSRAAPTAPAKNPAFPTPPTEEPKAAVDIDAPEVPQEPVMPNREEPLIS